MFSTKFFLGTESIFKYKQSVNGLFTQWAICWTGQSEKDFSNINKVIFVQTVD